MHAVLYGLALTAAAVLGSTGSADLLVLCVPAGPTAMMYGPAGAALASGPSAVLGNPALAGSGFAASGGRWNLSTTAVTAAGGITRGRAALAVGMLYAGRGDLTGRDASGEVTGGYSFSTGCMLAGGSLPLGSRLRIGLSGGIAWEDPGTGTAVGMTVSAGAAGEPVAGLRFGVGIAGLGLAPSWNGIRKAMPASVSAGAEWTASSGISVFAGGRLGFATAGSLGGGAVLRVGGLSLTAGYGVAPGEEEISGVFGGLRYVYRARGTYVVEAAFARRHSMEWPVTAGISVEL